MSLHSIKELDIFGSEIRWRLLSKDTFKTFFGSFVTLSLIGLIALKIYFFVLKVMNHGFVLNSETFRFNGDNQFINMSNFKFVLFSDLDRSLEYHYKTEGLNLNPRNYFNITDFFDISFIDFTSPNQTIKLNPIFVDCSSDEKFDFFGKNITKENASYYKCIKMDEQQNILNTSRKDAYLRPRKNEFINIQRDSIYQTIISINMKKALVDYLKKTKETVNIYFLLSNNRLNPENYMLEEYYSSFYFPINTDFVYETELKFRKLSINKILELDIFNHEYFEDNTFRFLDESFRMITKLIDKGNSDVNYDAYTNYIGLLLDTFEHNNEVILFTLDDLLSVIGGFMQLILSIAEIITGIYNDTIGEKLFSKFFWEKFCDYDKTLFHVRRNIDLQMKYYDSYSRNYDFIKKKDEGNFNKNKLEKNKKFKNLFNSTNQFKENIDEKLEFIEYEHTIQKPKNILDSAHGKNGNNSNDKLLYNNINVNNENEKIESNSSCLEDYINDEYVNEERKIADRFRKFKSESNIKENNLIKEFKSNDKILISSASNNTNTINVCQNANEKKNSDTITPFTNERYDGDKSKYLKTN